MGWFAPLAAGLITGGLTSYLGRRREQSQVKALQEAQAQNMAQASALATQMKQSQAATDLANQQAEAQANAAAAKSIASLGKATSGQKMVQLATIKTSPFGDTSTPFLGKRKLLGN